MAKLRVVYHNLDANNKRVVMELDTVEHTCKVVNQKSKQQAAGK